VTLNFKFDLRPHHRPFDSKVIPRTRTHTHTGPITVLGPLKWSARIAVKSLHVRRHVAIESFAA